MSPFTYISPHKSTCVSNGCLPRSTIWDKIQLPDRVFAKLLKLIPAYLRRKGIRKIDDQTTGGLCNPGLLHRKFESKHSTNARPSAVARFHDNLAGEVRPIVHTQSLTFLGLSIHSQAMFLNLPEKKILNVQNKFQSHSPSAHDVASLIGTLEAARPTIWLPP